MIFQCLDDKNKMSKFIATPFYFLFFQLLLNACSNSEENVFEVSESVNSNAYQEKSIKDAFDDDMTKYTEDFHETMVFSCANEEIKDPAEEKYSSDMGGSCSLDTLKSSSSAQKPIEDEQVAFDDFNYLYAGIPRVVIKTETEITDRDTEIPAKFQIWGRDKPESGVMDLTIRGRGNTSWVSPKKSYKIKFVDKQNVLGMPENRDWALISNYADKTLMKNFLAYRLSEKIGAYYSPKCKFIELFINEEYLGVYLIVETIKIDRHRIDMPKNSTSYIVEFDGKLREGEQAVYSYEITPKGKVFRVHNPKNATEEELFAIEDHIHSFENFLINLKEGADNEVDKWVDVDEYIKHYWVQEFSKNVDASFYTSVYFSWQKDELIKMGPVWDFDLSFGGHSKDDYNAPSKWLIRNYYWNKFIFKDSVFLGKVNRFWLDYNRQFMDVFNMIDSVAKLISPAATNNYRRWNTLKSTEYAYHRKKYSTYEEAVEDLKSWIRERINWIDEQNQKK